MEGYWKNEGYLKEEKRPNNMAMWDLTIAPKSSAQPNIYTQTFYVNGVFLVQKEQLFHILVLCGAKQLISDSAMIHPLN